MICISSRALERHRDRKWVATVKRNRPPLSSFRCRVRKFVRGITGSSYWCLVCVAGRANSMLLARDRRTPFRTQFGSGSLHHYHHQLKTVQRSWIHLRVWCGVWRGWWQNCGTRKTRTQNAEQMQQRRAPTPLPPHQDGGRSFVPIQEADTIQQETLHGPREARS